MTVALERNEFVSGAELAAALADVVADMLAAAIEARGAALLAVSGGSTPVLFFETLSRRDIDWPKVTVTLVDERFVPPTSERSNARLVRKHLLQQQAAKARFVGLFHETAAVEEAAHIASGEIGTLKLPLDVAVLGMGPDGHTASFFPDAEGLHRLLSPVEENTVLPVHAPSAGEPRLTLALPALAAARFAALHIEGEEKKAVFESAMTRDRDPLPIRTVIEHCRKPVHIFWAPKQDEQS